MVALEVAFDKLAQFKTADELADFLHSEGIKGYRKDANMCPIASFMESHTGRMVGVTEDAVQCYEAQGEMILNLDTTEAMYNFVVDFDAGEYEFLVAGLEPESSPGWPWCSDLI